MATKHKIGRQATAQDMINLLSKLPPDTKLFTEGCDCVGPCDGIEIDDAGDVILTRNDNLSSDTTSAH